MKIKVSLIVVGLAVAYQCVVKADGQSLDGPTNVPEAPAAETPLRRVQSVNIPLFYDMVKSGSSLGINVLQGLVKVERGEEAERNGLTGRRPLSVRIFGIPVYERGVRVRPAGPASSQGGSEVVPAAGGRGEEEELPIEPTANLSESRRSN